MLWTFKVNKVIKYYLYSTSLRVHFGLPIYKPVPAITSKWPGIVFHGLIRNQTSGKQVAWIAIDSHSFNMAPGAVQMGVELKRCFKDSIQVVFNSEKKTIKK
jgi:hypothetical protein